MTTRDPKAICESVCRAIALWAQRKTNINGLALVGSWARDAAQVNSDIDLVVLATDPQNFRCITEWLEEIAWPAPITKWADVSYGPLWSRHCELEDHTRVELGFCSREWASCYPIDPGTARVIRDGCRVLYDPLCLFEQLCMHVAQQCAAADTAKRRG